MKKRIMIKERKGLEKKTPTKGKKRRKEGCRGEKVPAVGERQKLIAAGKEHDLAERGGGGGGPQTQKNFVTGESPLFLPAQERTKGEGPIKKGVRKLRKQPQERPV